MKQWRHTVCLISGWLDSETRLMGWHNVVGKENFVVLLRWKNAQTVPFLNQFVSFWRSAPRILLPHLYLPIIPNAYFYSSIRLFTYCGAELKALRKKRSLALGEFPSFITIITNYFHCFPPATIRGFNQSVTLYNQLMDHSGVTIGEEVCFPCSMPASCHWTPPEYLRLVRC